MSLVNRIKEIAAKKGMKLAEIERYLGFGNSTIRKWDTNSPSLDKIIETANFLNVSINWLATGKKENSLDDTSYTPKNYERLSQIDKEKIDAFIEISLIENTKDTAAIYHSTNSIASYPNENNTDYIKEDVHEYMNANDDIPVLGYVAAGIPKLGVNEPLGYVEPPVNADYALYANGKSMEPVIMDGELIFVKQQPLLDNNDIGIIFVDEDTTCKIFKRKGNTIELHSFNEDFKPLNYSLKSIDTFLIQGKVLLTPKQRERARTLCSFFY